MELTLCPSEGIGLPCTCISIAYFKLLLSIHNYRGSTAEVATQNIIDVQIPALKDLCSSGSVSIDNIDVFCETGVFDTDASRRILRAGQEAGWKVNFHGDELHPMNSGEVNSGYQY